MSDTEPDAMRGALSQNDVVVSGAMAAHHGTVISTAGAASSASGA